MRVPLRGRFSGREILAGLFVLVGLALAVAVVYLVVVVGGGEILRQGDSPNLALSVLATGIVALGFGRVQRGLQRLATRWVLADRFSPYEVLSRFAEGTAGTASPDDVPEQMARLLAQGTCAEWAQVWLRIDDQLVLAATWPPDSLADTEPPGEADADGRRTRQVVLGQENLGAIRVREQPGKPLSAVEERLFAGLAAQAGLMMHGVRLRAELGARAAELAARGVELRRSRERLIDAQDDERRRWERDIHDGAQQHLVALAVNLRLAHTLAERTPAKAGPVLAQQADAAQAAIDTLLSLARGIYPRALTEEGIGGALRLAAAGTGASVVVEVGELPRQPAAVEAAVYFCILEAIQNAAKHAEAEQVRVVVEVVDGELTFSVADDGVGFGPGVAPGVGLSNMRDRMDDVNGSIAVASTVGVGTTVRGTVQAIAVEG